MAGTRFGDKGVAIERLDVSAYTIRLNDNVAVREVGNEVLSAALSRDLDWLVVD